MNDTDNKKDTATQLSILFAILAAHAYKGNKDVYAKTLLDTFNEFLNGMGYTVVPKEVI